MPVSTVISYPRRSAILTIVLAMVCEFQVETLAFTPLLTGIASQTHAPQTTFMRLYDTETDSEWYTPPPVLPSVPTSLDSNTSPIASLHGADNFQRHIQENDITVVKFYASWCKSCQRLGLLFRKLSNRHRDVSFAEVEYAPNQKLCDELQIRRLPTVCMYYQGKLLKTLPYGPTKFQRVKDALAYYERLTPAQLQQEAQRSVCNQAFVGNRGEEEGTTPVTGAECRKPRKWWLKLDGVEKKRSSRRVRP